jgi:hypothetical protein
MGMWIRSYWRYDEITLSSVSDPFPIMSMRGVIGGEFKGIPLWTDFSSWKSLQYPQPYEPSYPTYSFLYFRLKIGSQGLVIAIPYWFLVLTSGSLALVSKLRRQWQFTLRHLFIVTTFLAVVLGMIACLDRSWIGT